jgi:hypothetical protein
MLKRYLSYAVAGSLLLSAVSLRVTAQQSDKQPVTEQLKRKIARLGVGEKAKATITLKDGTKTKGYISRAGEDDFVMRDRKTDAATTIRYADVQQVDSNKGHSTARNIAIGVGIGVGAFLAVIAITLAHLD